MYPHISLCAIILATSLLSSAILIPAPAGPYAVSMELLSLTDTRRIDPYAPKGSHQKRRVMCSAFIPRVIHGQHCPSEQSSYMPHATAAYYGQLALSVGLPNNSFQDMQLQLCKPFGPKLRPRFLNTFSDRYPLFIFSPGFGNSRLLYTEYAVSLASQGYVVLTVDHSYDAPIVEFPDGSVITAANISEDVTSLSKLVHVRVADLSFVLSELPKQPSLVPLVDLRRIVAYGHSLGGATAAELTRTDKRVLGGVNMDGGLVEPALSSDLRKPFLQVGRPSHRSTDSTWTEFWDHLKGPKLELGINGTTHGSFLDLSPLLEVLGVAGEERSRLDTLLGTIPGHRAIEIATKILQGFGRLAFEGKGGSLCQTAYCTPEIDVSQDGLGNTKHWQHRK